MIKSKKNKTICRSSKTGRFVKKDYEKKHPNTTVKETIRKTSKK